jgi:hypothetical protein
MSVEPVFTCATLPFVGPSAAAVAKYPALDQPDPRALQSGRLPDGWRTAAAERPLGFDGQSARHPDRQPSRDVYLLIFAGVFSFLRGDALGGAWYVLIGWFIKDASAASYQQVRLDEALRGVTVRDAMVEAVVTVPPTGSVAEAAREQFMRTGYGGYPVPRGDAVVGLL